MLNEFIKIIKNNKFEYFDGSKNFPEIKIGLLDSYLKFKKKHLLVRLCDFVPSLVLILCTIMRLTKELNFATNSDFLTPS